MKKNNFIEIVHFLSAALVDDFRGFLVEGTRRLEVPDGILHLQIAYEELSKDPAWVYESGVGQNPLVEYLQFEKAIYVTKIPTDNKGEFQRTVGFLTNVYNNVIEYKGKQMLEYEALRMISLGMGYDVDEYTLLEKTEDSVKTPVSITTYKGEINIHTSQKRQNNLYRTLSPSDIPKFDSNGVFIGFISNGKFVSSSHYKRYANLSNKTQENESTNTTCKKR